MLSPEFLRNNDAEYYWVCPSLFALFWTEILQVLQEYDILIIVYSLWIYFEAKAETEEICANNELNMIPL